MTLISNQIQSSKHTKWYQPTFSPEHGVYVMFIISFLTGAIAAGNWNNTTTLALICAFCGLQAEHPLVCQIKQRKSWKPRLLIWTAIYGFIASALSLWFLFHNQNKLPLLIIYSLVAIALIFDIFSVFNRQQKSRVNELVTFAAVCLSAPLAYIVTIGTISKLIIALWILNSLFFSSSIFTVKLRKIKTASLIPSIIFHTIATGIILILWLIKWLTIIAAAAFLVVLIKFMIILWQKDWYCTANIGQIAFLETISSFIFLIVVFFSFVFS